ncbi:TPA: DUF2812 domain-containing protein [Streptococcus suis]
MKKWKLFTSMTDEEIWINHIQSQGYRLTRVNPWLGIYHFEKYHESPLLVRLDFHEQIKKEDYLEYLSLFEETGWNCLKGSQRCGMHYFQQATTSSSPEIFSDRESLVAVHKRYKQFALTYFSIFLIYFFIFYQSNINNGFYPWDPQSWFLTPGLWERDGFSFWFGFLLEMPFALFRSGIISIFFLALSVYFLIIAEKGKKDVKRLEQL